MGLSFSLVDRSSRPVHSPRRLPQRRGRRIINLRVNST
jgi:hypothetical protein